MKNKTLTDKERNSNSIRIRALMRDSARISEMIGDTFDKMIKKVDEIKDSNCDSCFGSMLNDQRGKIILAFKGP